MASLRRKIVVSFEDDGGLRRHTKEVRESKQAAQGLTGELDKSGKAAGRMSGVMKTAFAGVAAFIGTQVLSALGRVSGRLFEIGTAAEETSSKFRTVFGEAADSVDAFINTTGRMAGLTTTEGREITATLGAMAQGFDLSKQASADFSTQVVTLAADMASFNNTSIEESLRAIQSGLIGEQEPLRRYGILLSAATVEQKALEMSGKTAADSLSEQEKVLARLALAYEMAGVAVGDLERTQDSTVNTSRRLQAEARQLIEDFSTGLIPAYGELLARGKDLLEMFKANADTLGGAFATGIVNATEYVVDMGIAAGRTGSAVFALLDALSIFGGGSTGRVILDSLGRIVENFMNLHVAIRGATILMLEFRAAFNEFQASVQDAVGLDANARANRFDAKDARAEAEAQRELLRQQRAADLDRKREREERRQQLEAEIQAAKDAASTMEDYKNATGRAGKAVSDLAEAIKRMNEERFAVQGDRGMVADLPMDLPDLTPVEAIKGFHDLDGSIQGVRENLALLRDAYERATGDEQRERYKRLIEAHEQWLDGFEKVEEAAERAGRALADMAATGRALLRLAGNMGILSDELGRVARSAVDALASISDLNELKANWASSSEALPAVAGLFGGLIGVFKGAADAMTQSIHAGNVSRREQEEARRRQHQEHMQRLQELDRALRDYANALRRSNEALFGGGVVGRGVSREDIGAGQASVSALVGIGQSASKGGDGRGTGDRDPDGRGGGRGDDGGRGTGGRGSGSGRGREDRGGGDRGGRQEGQFSEEEKRQILEEVGRLNDLGIFEFDLEEYFDTLLEKYGGDFGLAREEFLFGTAGRGDTATRPEFGGVSGSLERLDKHFGQLTRDVEGATQAFRDAQQYFSQNALQAFQTWTEFMLQNVEDLSEKGKELFEELGGLDLSTEEGRARAREIMQMILSDPSILGAGFTPEDARTIADTINEGLTAGEAGGAGEERGFTSSTQIARTITEIQANEMLAILAEMSFLLKQIRDRITAAISLPQVPDAVMQVQSAPTFSGSRPFTTTQSLSDHSTHTYHITSSDPRQVAQEIEQLIRRRERRGFR